MAEFEVEWTAEHWGFLSNAPVTEKLRVEGRPGSVVQDLTPRLPRCFSECSAYCSILEIPINTLQILSSLNIPEPKIYIRISFR